MKQVRTKENFFFHEKQFTGIQQQHHKCLTYRGEISSMVKRVKRNMKKSFCHCLCSVFIPYY